MEGSQDAPKSQEPSADRKAWRAVWRTLRLAWWPGPADTPEEGDEPVPPRPKRTTEVDAAAYGAAVGHVINRPDGIRARAQVSATISAAVAAALVAFVPLTGLNQHEPWVQVLVALAILSWIVSLWRYILVIAFSYHAYEKETNAPKGPPTNIEEHLSRFLSYAAHIRNRVERGTAATTLALVLTLLAAVAVVAEPHVAGPDTLRVALSDEGLEAVKALCPEALHAMDARGRPGDLNRDVVALQLSKDVCGYDEDVVVHVRRAWIDAVRRPD